MNTVAQEWISIGIVEGFWDLHLGLWKLCRTSLAYEWVCPTAWESEAKVKSLSRVQLLATPCTVAYHALPFMGFSRQEYWSGLPFPSPEDLPDPGIEPQSPALQAGVLPSEPPGKSWEKLLFKKWKLLSCVWLFESPWTNISPWYSPG